MRRREFITLIGGAAATWPLAARAQEGMRRLGLLLIPGERDAEGQKWVRVIVRGLQEAGWTEGRNLKIDVRYGAGSPDGAGKGAEELVALGPDVIVSHGTTATAVLQRLTKTIPIVFTTVTDPVRAGFVASLSRPGANITGFSTFEPEIGGKWLELLREVSPGLKHVGGILDPAFAGFAAIWDEIQNLARQSGLGATTLVLRQPSDDIERATAAFAQQPDSGLIVLPTASNNIARERIFALAARYRLPAVYAFSNYATDGGLMAYGFDNNDIVRRSTLYVDRVLKGEKPANLPVQAPTKFELVINLKTAKAIGVTMPPAMLARADQVIE
jgi:putative ABC transport system substrate-binding protein